MEFECGTWLLAEHQKRVNTFFYFPDFLFLPVLVRPGLLDARILRFTPIGLTQSLRRFATIGVIRVSGFRPNGNNAVTIFWETSREFRRHRRGFLQKATKETKVGLFDFENLGYLRFLLLALIERESL